MEQQTMAGSSSQIEKTNRFWDFLVLWPIIYFVLMLSIIFPYLASSAASSAETGEGQVAGAFLAIFAVIFLGNLFLGVSLIVLLVYSIHRLYTRTNLPNKTKKFWVVMVLLFNVITIPILHFKYLRK